MTDYTFPLSGGIELNVRIGHGSVTVETEDGLDTASVRLTASNGATDVIDQTSVELNGTTLSVNGPRQGGIFDLPLFRGRGRGVDVHVRVPTGTPVKIGTFTAPIHITGHVGRADLAFGTGEADIAEVGGDLRLRFGSGLVKAARVRGSVQVRSGSGDARFGEVDGALIAGCGSGNLDVDRVRGPVRSRTGSGNARLGEVHNHVDVASGSGSVEIGIPEGLAARLDLHTGSGRVSTELPIENGPRVKTSTPVGLRARTGSGDVRLFRAA